MSGTFLTAEWRDLILANFIVDPKHLYHLVPEGTELDFWENKCYISLVGFMFKETKVKGISFPFHINFEEVNLRFYVRYKEDGEWKRGVTFIKEIVPKHAITFVANSLYNENYVTLPMQHHINVVNNKREVCYKWKTQNLWNYLKVECENIPKPLKLGGEEDFISEHYWGYTKNKKRTTEYRVEHPSWNFYKVMNYEIGYKSTNFYGHPFDDILKQKPSSVFLAQGSKISVGSKRTII